MKIILLGACGKMGANVTALCKETGDEIVCGVDLAPCPSCFRNVPPKMFPQHL